MNALPPFSERIGSGDHVRNGAENGCSVITKAQSAKAALKKPNNINSDGTCRLHARTVKETAQGIHIQEKGFLRNASK